MHLSLHHMIVLRQEWSSAFKRPHQTFFVWCPNIACKNELCSDPDTKYEEYDWAGGAPQTRSKTKSHYTCGKCATHITGSLDFGPFWFPLGIDIPVKIGYP